MAKFLKFIWIYFNAISTFLAILNRGTYDIFKLRQEFMRAFYDSYVSAATQASLYGTHEMQETLWLRAARLAERMENSDWAKSLCWDAVSSFYMKTKAFEKAEPYLKQLLLLRENLVGPNHEKYLETRYRLGIVYKAQGQAKLGVANSAPIQPG